MSDFKLTTPVAFIIFNRPDTTERVFAEIAKAKPTKLLVVADGPRQHKEGEAEKVKATRSIINRVDWPCEVLTNYSEDNLGCKVRVSSGIDWVFEQVEEAIILEDDCLPDPTFFRFCQEMLERYKDDQRIMLITGTNLAEPNYDRFDYYFSRYPHIWGWASWRRVWQQYDVSMLKLDVLKNDSNFQKSFQHLREFKYWIKVLEAVRYERVNTWDAQLVYLAFMSSMLTITPKFNLISNIGFGVDATHTLNTNSQLSVRLTHSIVFPLKHPNIFIRNFNLENIRKHVENIGVSVYFRLFQHSINLIRRFI